MDINNFSINNVNLSPRAMLGVCATFFALVLITFMHAVWQWHGDWVLAHNKPEPAASITKPDTSNTIISSIASNHLFGQSLSKLGDMPITTLQLNVTGIVKIMTQPTNSASKAYISISKQPSKIYQLGDHLPYGVRVYEITPDAVVLENNGHLEKLPLPREHLKFKSKPEESL